MTTRAFAPLHPHVTRRALVQAGAIGLLGCGMNHLAALRAEAQGQPIKARSCIYIFLSGGLSQLDSFDLKPSAPERIRGEFQPIATQTPGMDICEHLPQLAAASSLWSLCRSVTHPYNEHSQGHTAMLTGLTEMPPGYNPSKPQPTDFPSMAAVANAVLTARGNLPPAMVLPERLVHRTGRVIPGQGAGQMGGTREPWFIEASPFRSESYGAYPEFAFHHQNNRPVDKNVPFEAPNLSLIEGLDRSRFQRRLNLLEVIGQQQASLDQAANSEPFDRYRQKAIELLSDARTRQAFDINSAAPRLLDRYGRNSFGWSLLMARQLVEAGVSLVQVNLGNNESWDTHGNAFPHLKNNLLPPTDRAVSALLADLHERGLLESTLVVMASEFGRTPQISGGPSYATPGRNHWGGVQSVLLAGGGIQGGRVVGTSDKIAAYPASQPEKPENLAATIYQALGIPRSTAWHDFNDRPHFVYRGDPIAGLS